MRYLTTIIWASVILGLVGSCDWFDEPEAVNFPPETTILECPPAQVSSRDSLTIRWSGTDQDGHIVGYDWSCDAGGWKRTQAESVIIGGLPAGQHQVQVRSIDDMGEPDPTPATCTFTVTPTGEFVERIVLIELFTTTWCRNCPNSERALRTLLEEAGGTSLCIVAYHDTPERDGLATSETANRIDWYWNDSEFPGDRDVWPTVVFDGLRVVQGAESVEKARNDYAFEIGLRRTNPSPISLALVGDMTSKDKVIRAKAQLEHQSDFRALTLNAIVIEDSVSYHGWFSDQFDFVVRDILDTHAFELESIGDTASFEWSVTLDLDWDVSNLDVICFVQDTITKEVIQAVRLRQ